MYYVDTSKTPSASNQTYYNSQFKSDKDTISIAMVQSTFKHETGIYDDNVGLVDPKDLKMGDIIITNNYPPRYISKISKEAQASLNYNVEFTILKNIADGMLKITGSSGFGDAN